MTKIERERKRLWYLRPGETASCTGSWTDLNHTISFVLNNTTPDEILTSGMHSDRPRFGLLTENELSIRFFYESKACLHALAIVLYTRTLLSSLLKVEHQGNITGRFCQCSRCDRQGAKYIIEHLRYTTEKSYHEFSSYGGATIDEDKMSQPTHTKLAG
ncbi:BQ5605_C009g05460 [Microbotryum silenes-dioicae]|uniref:BQ5605_C009g05460 protein n=1 Tax=Microbotryum silenes-dioicae TaxID=796604 RepID=A0A2X0PEP7_9BASI|nr:BQ5605_C009g05460 [Microbotryum silenes-dioicae]